MLKKLACLIIACCISAIALAGGPDHHKTTWQDYAVHNFYIGLQAGYSWVPYSNDDLTPGFTATSIKNSGLSPRLFLGYNVTRDWALELNVIYFKKPHFHGLAGAGGVQKIKNNIVALMVRYNWHFCPRWEAYAMAGLGYVVRDGIYIRPTQVLSEGEIFRPAYGLGVNYRLTTRWDVAATWVQVPSSSSRNLPTSNYIGIGASYRFRF